MLVSVALLAGVTACEVNDKADEHSGPGRGIDARAYYDDYDVGDEGAGVVLFGSGSADAAVSGPTGPAADPGQQLPGQRADEPGLLDDNTFVDAGTSGFVPVAHDPLSTFALDVDTGSYTVARTLLDQGVLPPPASIRVEEWVNAFDFGDPAARGADVALLTEQAFVPGSEDGTQFVRIGVSTREVEASARPPVAVTLVVDRSGSMDIRERLGLVQSSLALLAGHLRPDDTIAVVSYDDAAHPILEPTAVRETDAILDAIDQLRPGGSTNLAAGLELGYEQARKSFREDGVNVVVLCSDGVANVGMTDAERITRRIADAGGDGIHLVTVGYGMGNYNDHVMEQLADRGDGFYSYVDTFEEAERLFVDELTTTLLPVATEARAQVVFNPDLVTSYRLVGYDNREIADEDFADLSVDAGELGAGHQVSALYEVRLAPGVEPGSRIGTATVQWAPVEGGRARVDTNLVAADPAAEPSTSMQLALTVADFAQVLKGAQPVAVRGLETSDLVERARVLVRADVEGAGELTRLIRGADALR